MRATSVGQDVRRRWPRRMRSAIGGYEKERGACALVNVGVEERLVRFVEMRRAVIVVMMVSITLRVPPAVRHLEGCTWSCRHTLPDNATDEEENCEHTHWASIPARLQVVPIECGRTQMP